jgi:hypothetical protein
VLQTDQVTGLRTPGLDRNVVIAALNDLREEALYLHFTGRRYRFEPTPNLAKLVRDEASKFEPHEILDRVRSELEEIRRIPLERCSAGATVVRIGLEAGQDF